ncbi:hypothetical protein EBF04_07405 [Streptomyces sp. I6]|nr:hypothetical protein EBF04_07405 [Streptomyces sp. I6]
MPEDRECQAARPQGQRGDQIDQAGQQRRVPDRVLQIGRQSGDQREVVGAQTIELSTIQSERQEVSKPQSAEAQCVEDLLGRCGVFEVFGEVRGRLEIRLGEPSLFEGAFKSAIALTDQVSSRRYLCIVQVLQQLLRHGADEADVGRMPAVGQDRSEMGPTLTSNHGDAHGLDRL